MHFSLCCPSGPHAYPSGQNSGAEKYPPHNSFILFGLVVGIPKPLFQTALLLHLPSSAEPKCVHTPRTAEPVHSVLLAKPAAPAHYDRSHSTRVAKQREPFHFVFWRSRSFNWTLFSRIGSTGLLHTPVQRRQVKREETSGERSGKISPARKIGAAPRRE